MGTYDPGYQEYLRVGKLAETLTNEEEQLFHHLMETDHAFRQSFTELTQTLTPSYLSGLQKFKEQEAWPSVDEIAPRRAIVQKMGWVKIAAAACILLALGIAIPVMLHRNNSKQVDAIAGIELKLSDGKKIDLSQSKGAISADEVTMQNTGNQLSYKLRSASGTGMNTLSVAPGKDYRLTLADGSEIWLNATSTLEFPFAFNGATREIKITGEAWLKIAKDRNKPFIVHLPGSSVQVTGTEFNVNTYDTGTVKVSLVEGGVIFTDGKSRLPLQPGRQGVQEAGRSLYEQPFNLRNTLSWKEGLYYFEKSRVDEIIRVIERWYNIKVVVDNSRNNDKRFVGVLNKKKPLEDFLSTLEYVAEIHSYRDAANVLHFR